MPQQNKRTFVVLAAGASLAGCALLAYAATRRRRQSAPGQASDAISFEATDKTKQVKKEVEAAQLSQAAKLPKTPSDGYVSTPVAPAESLPFGVTSVAGKPVDLPLFSCSIRPPPGWVIAREPMPLPTIAMIQIRRPEFEALQQQEATPGTVPVIVLTIEDVSQEHVTVLELKEKNKMMAYQQMAMMTQGAWQPDIVYDDPLSVGPFEHCLEYSQSIPPYLDMRFNNLLTVKNGLAYAFQLLANSKVYLEYKPIFMDMARGILIDEDRSEATRNFVVGPHIVNHVSTGISVAYPVSWKLNSPENYVAQFITGSQTKPDLITVYKQDDDSAYRDLDLVRTTEVEGVPVKFFAKAGKERQVVSMYGFTLVAANLKSGHIETSTEDLVACARSLHEIPASGTTQRWLVNPRDGYKAPISLEGSVLASKIGGGTILYAPGGMESLQQNESPTVTFRRGVPGEDEGCAATLEGWKANLLGDDPTLDVKNTTLAGVPALTFDTTETTEEAPGRKTEVKATVVIAIHRGATLLVRWETPVHVWDKFASDLKKLLSSIEFI